MHFRIEAEQEQKADLAKALAAFESKWLAARARRNARKLKLAEKKALAKTAAAAKKIKAKVSALNKAKVTKSKVNKAKA